MRVRSKIGVLIVPRFIHEFTAYSVRLSAGLCGGECKEYLHTNLEVFDVWVDLGYGFYLNL